MWGLVLAREKRQKLRAVSRARAAGAIVLCDRYPQNEIMGFNDGPLLSEWRHHDRAWRRLLARWESGPYEWAHLHPPDLVVKMRVSAAVALARKPDMEPDEVARRIAAIETMSFGPDTRTLVIDADAPIEQVIRAARPVSGRRSDWSRPMVVEFFGLPGAGKSKLSRSTAADDLTGQRIAVQQPSRSLAHGIGPHSAGCGRSLHVLRECFRTPRPRCALRAR